MSKCVLIWQVLQAIKLSASIKSHKVSVIILRAMSNNLPIGNLMFFQQELRILIKHHHNAKP